MGNYDDERSTNTTSIMDCQIHLTIYSLTPSLQQHAELQQFLNVFRFERVMTNDKKTRRDLVGWSVHNCTGDQNGGAQMPPRAHAPIRVGYNFCCENDALARENPECRIRRPNNKRPESVSIRETRKRL